jgi:hypothetical protein
MDLAKLVDYGVVAVAAGLVMDWLGYSGDFLVTLGLLMVFLGVVARVTGRT